MSKYIIIKEYFFCAHYMVIPLTHTHTKTTMLIIELTMVIQLFQRRVFLVSIFKASSHHTAPHTIQI